MILRASKIDWVGVAIGCIGVGVDTCNNVHTVMRISRNTQQLLPSRRLPKCSYHSKFDQRHTPFLSPQCENHLLDDDPSVPSLASGNRNGDDYTQPA